MSNIKQFDLARWKAGDEVMYRDGKEVLDMHYFEHQQVTFPIHALAWDGSFTSHMLNGKFDRRGTEHPRDIVMKPKKQIYWLVSWPEYGDRRRTSQMYTSKEQLLANEWKQPFKIHEIEIEE